MKNFPNMAITTRALNTFSPRREPRAGDHAGKVIRRAWVSHKQRQIRVTIFTRRNTPFLGLNALDIGGCCVITFLCRGTDNKYTVRVFMEPLRFN